MSLKTSVVCDICGEEIKTAGEQRRTFKVKEHRLQPLMVRRMGDLDFGYVRNWEQIDCHDECIAKLLRAKRATEGFLRDRSSG